MAVRFEYWSAVYAVGLEGLNDADHQELTDYSGDGWEPVLMTSVHGGFGTLILFRREAHVSRPVASRKATVAKKSTPTKTTKTAKTAKTAKAVNRASSTKRG